MDKHGCSLDLVTLCSAGLPGGDLYQEGLGGALTHTITLAPRKEAAMFTYRFWQLASERAVKTFAQSLVAILSATGFGLLTAPWSTVLSTAGMAAVLSVLTSMASAPVGEPNSPSLLPAASTSSTAS